MKKNSRNSEKGSSTIEILIAFMVLTLALTAVVIVVFGTQALAIDTQTNQEALYRAQTILEEARALAQDDFSSIVSTPSEVEYSGLLAYTKKLDVSDIDLFTKHATSTVTWQSGGRTLSVELSTHLTDPDTVLGGDTCTEDVSGDWTAPQRFGYGDITSNTGATGLDAFNHKVYLTTNPSGGPQDDFYIFDVSDPDPAGGDLPIISQIDTGYGLEDVRVAGRFVYVVAADTVTAHLLVIDTIDIANPSVVATLDVTSAGTTGYGNTIAYVDGKVYLGLTKSTGREFYVVDVSNPLSPTVVGTLETNTAINQIVVDRDTDTAYLALASDPEGHMWKLDISDPANPAIAQKFFPSSDDWVGQGVALSKTTSQVFLGRIYDIGDNAPDLYAFSTGDITTPLGSVTETKQDGFSRMVVRSGYLFSSNAAANLGFQVWDVSDPTNMTMHGSLNIQQASTAGMDCEGNYIFIGQRSNRALQIVGPS